MRLLLLLIIAGIAAHFTVPTREAHEAKARVALQAYHPDPNASGGGGNMIDDALAYVRGMMAGQGRYDDYYVLSKYSVDMPGADYLECYGAYTIVQCNVVTPASGSPA